jgi:hypothetical protein
MAASRPIVTRRAAELHHASPDGDAHREVDMNEVFFGKTPTRAFVRGGR